MKYVDIKEKGIPLYISLKVYLKQQIDTGKIKAGHSLPSEQFLSEKFGLSRVTVRRAIDELIDEGVVTRLKGRSPIVPNAFYYRDFNRLTGFSEQAISNGKTVSSKIFNAGVIVPSSDIATKLNLHKNDKCYYIYRLRYNNGNPIAIQKIYINGKYIKKLTKDELNNKSLYGIYEERGIELDYGVQTISSRMPTKEEKEILEIESNVPIIFLDRIAYVKNGDPLEVTYTFSNANQYSITIKLYR